MCFIGPNTILTIYTHDEGPRETIRAGYDMEEGMQ